MMRLKPLFSVAAVLALAGCATTPVSRVTRFHLDQPIARGEISVEPLVPADRNSLEFQTYASIVGAELVRTGFAEAPGLKQSEQVAVIAVERGTRDTMPEQRTGVSVGGSTGSYGSGVGVGISFPIGKKKPSEIVITRLTVQIKRRSEQTVVWEGRADTSAVAGSAEADPQTAVRRLAAAMFRDFPGPSGQTVTVK